MPVVLDVAKEDQWEVGAEKALARFGKIHMVVNNAGVGGESGSIESQNNKGWQWALDVNLMGVVYGAKVMVPLIKQHDEGGWVGTMGKYRITEQYDSKEDCIIDVGNITWNRIVQVLILINQIL